ncbi:MAG: class I SAM-dependent rRNA methyltransferase [bacterium]|nr:MAG: class I SAM-dependent rRNA methyltransferase [bacterium]
MAQMKSLENESARVILKENREKSVKNYHPWIFSGAVEKVEGNFQPGDIVPVFSSKGDFLAKGFINPHSQIFIRILSFIEEPINESFFRNRITTAAHFRETFISQQSNAYRVIHGDADHLSGLVIDKYSKVLVVQIFSLGMERLRSQIRAWLVAQFSPQAIIERSDSPSRREESLKSRQEIWEGSLSDNIIIEENGIRYRVDVWKGQKTGFYLDQRDNRARIAKLAAGKKLLNCFSYSGGFSVAAARMGAQTTAVDASSEAIALARENFSLNGINPAAHRFQVQDVFEYLKDEKELYDIIVLDPPAFIKKRSHLAQGSRAYKEVNRLAMQRLRPQGLLLSCSCSSHLGWEHFQKNIFVAARESGRTVQIIGRFSQPLDHPVNIFHPEGEYLKSFLLRVV